MQTIKQISIPSVFQLFNKKTAFRYTIREHAWNQYSNKALNKLVDSKVPIYGTFDKPYFKAMDLVQLCAIPMPTMRRHCQKLQGKAFLNLCMMRSLLIASY